MSDDSIDKLHAYGIELAKQTAQFSTCLSSHYGSIILNPVTKYIVASGRNGAPRGKDHCNEIGYCLKRECGYTHHDTNIEQQNGFMFCVCVHSEINALLQAGKEAYGCYLYLWGERNGAPIIPTPCFQCTKAIINAGIEKVIIKPREKYIEIDPSILYDKYVTDIISNKK